MQISGGHAESQAALFVELLCGVQVELVRGDRTAESFGGNIAERAALPRVSRRKKERPIAPNKNIRLDFWLGSDLRSPCAALTRFVVGRPGGRLLPFRLSSVRLLLRIGWRSFVYIVRKERKTESSTEKKWEKRVGKPAISISIPITPMNSSGLDRGQMGVIEAQPGHHIL